MTNQALRRENRDIFRFAICGKKPSSSCGVSIPIVYRSECGKKSLTFSRNLFALPLATSSVQSSPVDPTLRGAWATVSLYGGLRKQRTVGVGLLRSITRAGSRRVATSRKRRARKDPDHSPIHDLTRLSVEDGHSI